MLGLNLQLDYRKYVLNIGCEIYKFKFFIDSDFTLLKEKPPDISLEDPINFDVIITKHYSHFHLKLLSLQIWYNIIAQPAFTCSKLRIETLEKRCEICSELTIKPPKRCQWRCFVGFIVNFEHISHLCSSVSIVKFEHVIADWVSVICNSFNFNLIVLVCHSHFHWFS